MDAQIEVTLIAPAKVHGERRPVGATVFVTTREQHQLEEAGAVEKSFLGAGNEDDFDDPASDIAHQKEIERRAKEIASTLAFDAVSDALAPLQEERDEALTLAKEMDREKQVILSDAIDLKNALKRAEARIADLEKQIAAAAKQDNPEPKPNEAPKKAGGKAANKPAPKN